MTINLQHETPANNHITFLAPPIRIVNIPNWWYEYAGQALSLIHDGKIEIITDDGVRLRVPSENVVFVQPRAVS